MLIIDDCSTDNGYKFVQALSDKDSRIKLLKMTLILVLLSHAIKDKGSTGKYIAFR